MQVSPIIDRMNYVVRDVNPVTSQHEFHRVNATIMELTYLGRFYKENDVQFSFYESRVQDTPGKGSRTLVFEDFLKKRGLGFGVGAIIRKRDVKDESIGEAIFYTTIALLVACALAAVIL